MVVNNHINPSVRPDFLGGWGFGVGVPLDFHDTNMSMEIRLIPNYSSKSQKPWACPK